MCGVALNQHGFGGFEAEYLRVRRGLMEETIRDFRVLAAEDGAVMGFVLLGRWSAFPGGPLVLDTFVHPNFIGDAVALVEAVDLPESERVIALSHSTSEGRAEALEAAGFARETVLGGAVSDDDGGRRDVVIYARG